MLKKLLSVSLFLIGIFGVQAQMNQELPLNPKVKSGVLPNGLSYYILHNEEPKERANFYIAQKVGSTLEDQDQLGLAHFLEHMAFNGTTNYPGKSMLNYLQSKGIRFGYDINAYTGFDETVYNINNVPTTDVNLMDSVLLVLHDWSGEILLEESEIDAERGVIQEEWRSRNNANFRMWQSVLPQIYEEYQYSQMPIGSMEVIMNFKPEVLRAYYKKWYRPDQQGIVIVGDFDADEMEKKVIDLFSSIPMPENAAPRLYPEVSDNVEPIYASFEDPEMSRPLTIISFKKEKLPFELRNTMPGFINDLMQTVVMMLIDNRLNEYALQPDCDYSSAGVYFGDFFMSKTKDAFNIQIIAKNGQTPASIADAMAVIARACKTGFTQSELDRVNDEILSQLEARYNERDKTDNENLARDIIRHFIDNTPEPGIETQYQMVQQFIPMLPLEAYNSIAAEILTSDNMVVMTAEPKKEGFELTGKEVMLTTIANAINAEYEAYQDEVITEPLISQLPKPGSIISTSENEAIGTVTYKLSNGATVVVKPTDFSSDQIILTAFRDGGKQIYSPDQAPNIIMIGDAFTSSKMGPFDMNTLKKYLSGKQAGIEFNVNSFTDAISGFSTVKDLPTLMELLYTAFTNINADDVTYNVNLERIKTYYENVENNPNIVFSRNLSKTQYGGNPLMGAPTVESITAAQYPVMVEMIKNILGNAAEYTFIFTGNIDLESFRPMIEQYIASLPSAPVSEVKVVTPIVFAKGDVQNIFQQPMQAPSTHVYDIYSDNNLPYTAANYVMVDLAGDVLSNIFTDTLREEEGGTYSPSVGSYMNPNTGDWVLVYYFITNADQQAKLIDRAHAEYLKLLENGADEVNFNKVKEAAIKQYEINSKKNEYWDSQLMTKLRFPESDIITGYENALQNLTLEQFNAFLKSMKNDKNRIQIIMEGVAE